MVYSGTITTEAEIALMAGENVDVTGDTEANHNLLVAQAEGYLSGLIQDDVVAGFAGYDTVTKQLLSEYASRYTATALIAFNMTGYATDEGLARIHGETMMSVHILRMAAIEKLLNKGNVLKQLGAS